MLILQHCKWLEMPRIFGHSDRGAQE